jgi:hypothetical protein
MPRTSCSTSRISRPPEPQIVRPCEATSFARASSPSVGQGPALEKPVLEGRNLIASAAHNLSRDELAERLRVFGPLERQMCYSYVVRTVLLIGGEMVQTASAPNFDAGIITLCTCKHSMRTLWPAETWRDDIWVAGMSSSGIAFRNQQSLVYLMRVREAYSSHFELFQALQDSGRSAAIGLKAATMNRRGDLMIPRSSQLPPSEHLSVSGYVPPMVSHKHRGSISDTEWEKDVTRVPRMRAPAALLVGDPAFSFTWSKQMIRNTESGALRPWRDWDLGTLMSYLEDFQK